MNQDKWSENNLISLIKELARGLVSNYRRINLTETIPKILNNELPNPIFDLLKLWYYKTSMKALELTSNPQTTSTEQAW